jgi:hypothetical protein
MAQVFKGAGQKVAKLPGLQPVIQSAAMGILARARALAGGQADTTAYMSSLHVVPTPGRRGVTDRLVVAGDPAAVHIEYGHLATRKDGGATWVPGQYILTRAINGGN